MSSTNVLPVLAGAIALIACTDPPSAGTGTVPATVITDSLPAGFMRVPTDDSTSWLYHFEDLLFEGEPHARFAVLRPGTPEPDPQDSTLRDTLFQDERFVVRGSFRHTELPYQRYVSKLRPEQFPATPYTGPLAKPMIASDPNARHFRTMIRSACAKKGVNFAGHYTIAEWGCGAMCQMLAVVDRMDGRVYFTDIPFDTLDGHYGAHYAADSRMILVNAELAAWRPGYRVLFGGQWPSTYVWNEKRKRFELVETIDQ